MRRVTGALYSAGASAASYARRKLTQKTFKPALQKALEHLCESFELEDGVLEDGCTSVVARNLVLKRAVLDAMFARMGMRLADATEDDCPRGVAGSIGALRLVISWRARKDLGLFSEPWRLEVDDLHIYLRLGTAAPPRSVSARQARVEASPAAAEAGDDTDDSDDESQVFYDAEEYVGEVIAVVGEFFSAETSPPSPVASERADEAGAHEAPPLRWEEPAPDATPPAAATVESSPAAPTEAAATEAETKPVAAADAADRADAPTETAPPKADMLPFHRAAENLRLVMRRVRLTFLSDAPLAAADARQPSGRSELRLGLDQLSLVTTGPDWAELSHGVRGVGGGETLHKLLRLAGLEIVAARPQPTDGDGGGALEEIAAAAAAAAATVAAAASADRGAFVPQKEDLPVPVRLRVKATGLWCGVGKHGRLVSDVQSSSSAAVFLPTIENGRTFLAMGDPACYLRQDSEIKCNGGGDGSDRVFLERPTGISAGSGATAAGDNDFVLVNLQDGKYCGTEHDHFKCDRSKHTDANVAVFEALPADQLATPTSASGGGMGPGESGSPLTPSSPQLAAEAPPALTTAAQLDEAAARRFAAAAAAARGLRGIISSAQRLRLYGLYKQATVGPPDVAPPSRVAVQTRAKWDAWHAASSLSPEEACAEYCELSELLSGPGPEPTVGGAAAEADMGAEATAAASAEGGGTPDDEAAAPALPESVGGEAEAAGAAARGALWAEMQAATDAAEGAGSGGLRRTIRWGRRLTRVASWVDVDARITKLLQGELHGRVVRDFLGDRYLITLSAQCAAQPTLELPRCDTVLAREDDGRGGFDYIFRSDGGTHAQSVLLQHQLAADDSRELTAWYRSIMEAKAAALQRRSALLDRQLNAASANTKATTTDAVVVVAIDETDMIDGDDGGAEDDAVSAAGAAPTADDATAVAASSSAAAAAASAPPPPSSPVAEASPASAPAAPTATVAATTDAAAASPRAGGFHDTHDDEATRLAALSASELRDEVARLRGGAVAAEQRARERDAAAAASAAALRSMGQRVVALEAACARLASHATRAQHNAVQVHDALSTALTLTNLLRPEPSPTAQGALVSALELATTLRSDATTAAVDGANAMSAAFSSPSRPTDGAPFQQGATVPTADAGAASGGGGGKSTWREASGRSSGPADYRLGDATRSVYRWAVGATPPPKDAPAPAATGGES